MTMAGEICYINDKVNNIEFIFKEYYGSLCYFASQYLNDEEAVEDLVQDVFITLLEKKMFFQSIKQNLCAHYPGLQAKKRSRDDLQKHCGAVKNST